MANTMDDAQLQQLLSPLRGLFLVSAGLSSTGSLQLDLAENISDRTQRARHARARLWVFCAWRVESKSQLVVGREDERESLLRRLYDLDMVRVSEVKLTSPMLDAEVLFEDGHTLILFPWSVNDPHWRLRLASGITVQVGPGSVWTVL